MVHEDNKDVPPQRDPDGDPSYIEIHVDSEFLEKARNLNFTDGVIVSVLRQVNFDYIAAARELAHLATQRANEQDAADTTLPPKKRHRELETDAMRSSDPESAGGARPQLPSTAARAAGYAMAGALPARPPPMGRGPKKLRTGKAGLGELMEANLIAEGARARQCVRAGDRVHASVLAPTYRTLPVHACVARLDGAGEGVLAVDVTVRGCRVRRSGHLRWASGPEGRYPLICDAANGLTFDSPSGWAVQSIKEALNTKDAKTNGFTAVYYQGQKLSDIRAQLEEMEK